MSTITNVIDDLRSSFPEIEITGFYDSSNASFELNLGELNFFDSEVIFGFCETCLVSGNTKQFMEMSFSRRYTLVFKNIGDGYWVILGGKGLLSYRVSTFLSELIDRNTSLTEEIVEVDEHSLEVHNESAVVGEDDENDVFSRFPKIWEVDEISVEEEGEFASLSKSAYKLRRKQYLKFYKELKSAKFDQMFANYFLMTNSSLDSTKNFYWYKKIGSSHCFFLAKSNNPKLNPIINYFNLANFINDFDPNVEPNPQKLYKEIKKIVRDFVLFFDESETEQEEDYVGVFCMDSESMTMKFACNGFYFSSIWPESNSIVLERFGEGKMPREGEYNLESGEKYFIFSEEIFDLHEGDFDNKKNIIQDCFLSYSESEDMCKDKMDGMCSSIQEANGVNPDYLLCYVELL